MPRDESDLDLGISDERINPAERSPLIGANCRWRSRRAEIFWFLCVQREFSLCDRTRAREGILLADLEDCAEAFVVGTARGCG